MRDPVPAMDCDLLVCGGGVAGTMAAVAAARRGARVILAERYGFLGGNATAGAVAQFISWQTAAGRRVVAGLADEVVQRLCHQVADRWGGVECQPCQGQRPPAAGTMLKAG